MKRKSNVRVTIKDIAKAAGVSIVTVSRAFNNKPDIDAQTKKKILAISREMNYLPNSLARSLRGNRTKSIGIVIPDISDPFYAEILHGTSKFAVRNGYQIILSVLSERGCDAEEEIEAIKTLIGKHVDGLLLQPEQENINYIETLKKSPVPFVLWNRQPKGLDCSFVLNDHEYGSFLAVNHLVSKGHKEIYYLIRMPKTGSLRLRLKGCYRAAEKNGLSENAIHLVESDDSPKNAYIAVQKLLEQGDKPTAIFAWDDIMAIGAVKAIMDKGLRIPHDIAVVGYDDIEIAAYFCPPLTTIRQKTVEIGENAAEILIRKINGEEINPKNIILQPELVIRQTT